jgi:hypothetical protein
VRKKKKMEEGSMALVPRDSGMERIEELFMSSWRWDLWAYGMEDKANLGRKNGRAKCKDN